MRNTLTLHESVDALIQRTRIKLTREDTKRQEWQTLPSLWEQLQSAIGYATGQGGTGAAGSRPTIATGIVSLIIEISDTAGRGAKETAGNAHPDVPRNLRAIASNTPEGADNHDWWQQTINQWATQARAELNLDPSRPRWARGVRCPDCQADTATTTIDREPTRHPALGITWTGPEDPEAHPQDTDWKVRAVQCHACGMTWWRGTDLDLLVEQMLNINTTRETMTA